jgi:hypothetical protein
MARHAIRAKFGDIQCRKLPPSLFKARRQIRQPWIWLALNVFRCGFRIDQRVQQEGPLPRIFPMVWL